MKAYLIDPFAKTVTEVERPSDGRGMESLHEVYSLLHCHTITAVRPQGVGTDLIYLDGDGLFKDDQAFFTCRLWRHEVLAGRGLWIGSTPAGDDASPRTVLAYVRAAIVFQ